MPKYKRAVPETSDPYQTQPLPINVSAAIYYRQSSEGQIGNISTTLQTVDMFEQMIKRGWKREHIILIDMDAGVSGTKKMSERAGMSYLLRLIDNREIGLVAAQDVDRLFRDVKQIDTNIFIDCCAENNVQVMTPSFVYDFAHPIHGRYHKQLFREQAHRGADFIEFHIKGRLLKSKVYMTEQRCQWVGTIIPLGYLVDERTKLPDGTPNPNLLKFAPFEPHASIVRRYFELFREHNGNLKRTIEHIRQHGPFIPEDVEIPAGFRYYSTIRTYSRITGKLMVSRDGLDDMLKNVNYIGYWVYKGVIVNKYNHEPIIPYDLFMYAFNKLSSVDFYGDPNPEYMPYRPFNRHKKENRPVEPPAYSGVVFSDARPDGQVQRMHSIWNSQRKGYDYRLPDRHDGIFHLVTASEYIDNAVDSLLIERLKATTIDEVTWRDAVNSTHTDEYHDVKRLQKALRSAEQTRQHILSNLQTVSHPEIVKNLEERYIINEQEITRIQSELTTVQATDHYQRMILEARPVVEKVIARWQRVPHNKRRELFDAFAEQVMVSKIDSTHRKITVKWRDGSQSSTMIQPLKAYHSWTKADIVKIREMVENHVDQVEILRAYPGVPWNVIQQRYSYHSEAKRWFSEYRGKRPYTGKTRWEDTKEYAMERAASNSQSGDTSTSNTSISTSPDTTRRSRACASWTRSTLPKESRWRFRS